MYIRLFNIWSTLAVLTFLFNLLYVPFAIGLSYQIPGYYITIDIVVIVLMACDSLLRPFLAINK